MNITNMYNARVEVGLKVSGRSSADVEKLGRVQDALEQYHAAVSISRRGWAEAQISLPAESLAQATATACAVVGQAFGVDAIAAEVMTESEFLVREGWEPVPELVNVTKAAELLGVSRQAVLDRIARGTLPATKSGEGRTAGYVIPRSALEAAGAKMDA